MKNVTSKILIASLVALFACSGEDDVADISQVNGPGSVVQVSPAGGTRFDTVGVIDGSVRGFSGFSESSVYTTGTYSPDSPSRGDLRGTSWGTNRMDYFSRSDSGQILHFYTTDGASSFGYDYWGVPSGWTLTGSPGAASWGTNRLDVFTLATNNSTGSIELWHRAWNGSSLTSWESFGKPSGVTLTGGVNAVSWGSSRIDIFVRDTSSNLRHAVTTNGSNQGYWDNWSKPTGVTFTTDPVVISMGNNDMQVFAVDTNSHIRHAAWNSSTGFSIYWDDWGAPNDGGTIITTPGALAISSTKIVVAINSQKAYCDLTVPHTPPCPLTKILHRTWDYTAQTLTWSEAGTAFIGQSNDAPSGLTMTGW